MPYFFYETGLNKIRKALRISRQTSLGHLPDPECPICGHKGLFWPNFATFSPFNLKKIPRLSVQMPPVVFQAFATPFDPKKLSGLISVAKTLFSAYFGNFYGWNIKAALNLSHTRPS